MHAMGRGAESGSLTTDGVTAWRGDVRSADDVAGVVAHVVAAAGRLDALVCCAGIAASGPFESQSAGDLDNLLRTNVLGTMLACQAALPHLQATRGTIALIGSTLADHPRPMTSAYAATKGALDSLAKALAVEYGPKGVRVNCVRPSMVRTDLMLKSGVAPVLPGCIGSARAELSVAPRRRARGRGAHGAIPAVQRIGLDHGRDRRCRWRPQRRRLLNPRPSNGAYR